MRIAVAMANTAGGYLVFFVNNTYDNPNFLTNHLSEVSIPIVKTFTNFTLGVDYNISADIVFGHLSIVVEIYKAVDEAFFSRSETSEHRQIYYIFAHDEHTWQIKLYDRAKRDDKKLVKSIHDEWYRYGDEDEGNDNDSYSFLYRNIFKYMSLEAFITSLHSGTWRFFEPHKWSDKFERRFYCANYQLPMTPDSTPQLFATCVTKCRNSEAAWKVYSLGQGLGGHCVQIKLDIGKLRRQIRANKVRYYERVITYHNEGYLFNLHLPGKPGYSKYFKYFNLKSFLRLLALKRDAYSYEQEVRLFVIPKPKQPRDPRKKPLHHDLKISWKDVIEEVRVDRNCSYAELLAIITACHKAGIDSRFSKRGKYPKGVPNITAPVGSVKIPFRLFNIDDMPGPAKITIK